MSSTHKDECLKPIEEPGTFWMVWNSSGGAPRATHRSEDSAITEAHRLARLSPSHVFVVLKAISAFRMSAPPPPPVDRVPLSAADTVPF